MGSVPPHRGPTFLLEFFDTRDFSKKSVLGQRLGWGGWPKMKEFWKNLDYTWSGKIFDCRSAFFKSGFWALWGKMTNSGPKWPKNSQKWAKMNKVGQKRIFRMLQSRHVHIQPCTPSAGMYAPC